MSLNILKFAMKYSFKVILHFKVFYFSLLVKRERAVTAELAKQLEVLQKRERDDRFDSNIKVYLNFLYFQTLLIFFIRLSGRLQRVATVEATAFSIGYNNMIFLALMVLCSFFVFIRLDPFMYVALFVLFLP